MIINPQTKKYIPWIFTITLIATVFLMFMDIKYYKEYRSFVKVDAIITSIERHEVTSPSSDSRSSFYNYITYEYTFKGKAYSATRNELTRIGKKKGKKITVKCNPNVPREIQDVYGQNMCMMITIFCLLVDWLLWMAMNQIRKEENTDWR